MKVQQRGRSRVWLAVGVGALVALLLSGCSSFPSTYERAAGAYREALAEGLEPASLVGPWEGRWVSEPTGHEGPLWCLVAPAPGVEEGAEGDYTFSYRAGWVKLLRGDFTQTVPVRKAADGGYEFESSMDLGRLGGVYSVESELGNERWQATYESTKGDRGTMSLRRPGAGGGGAGGESLEP